MTIFLVEHNENGKWVKRHGFYVVDINDCDLKTDYRFCEVKDKRKEAIVLGTVSEISFPVAYPITLDSGLILNAI